MHLQESGEMYLETIYILSKKIGSVRSPVIEIFFLLLALMAGVARLSFLLHWAEAFPDGVP